MKEKRSPLPDSLLPAGGRRCSHQPHPHRLSGHVVEVIGLKVTLAAEQLARRAVLTPIRSSASSKDCPKDATTHQSSVVGDVQPTEGDLTGREVGGANASPPPLVGGVAHQLSQQRQCEMEEVKRRCRWGGDGAGSKAGTSEEQGTLKCPCVECSAVL